MPLSSAIVVLPCAGADLGVLRAEGEGATVVDSQTRLRFWAALRGGLRADFTLAGPLALGVSGGAIVPLTRDELVFRAPVEPVYRAPAIAGFGGVDLGVRFP